MTTMDVSTLLGLGFNRNEAIVYAALARRGRSDAAALIKETKFHKNIVYDNLTKLIDKGLVTYIDEGKRLFEISGGDMLERLFDDQLQELNEKRATARQVAKELDALRAEALLHSEARIYRGVNGVRAFYEQALQGGEYLFFGAPLESIKVMGEHFWFNHDLRREEAGHHARMIFNSSIRYHGEKLKNAVTQIRYFPTDFEPLTETHIQDDVVAIIVWGEEPVVFAIKDERVAHSYRIYFETMWKQAVE